MKKSETSKEGVSELILEETIDITVINNFYTDLKSLLTGSASITIDAQNVKRVDTSALQLLCSWYQEALNKGATVNWKNTEGVFYQSAKLLGVSKFLSLEQ